jgi:hypothetical protein
VSGLSDGDREWLETRFREVRDEAAATRKVLEEKIDGKESKITGLRIDVETMKANNPHKCTEEIAKHEASSWSHNPYKAGGLLASIFAVVEGAKKFFGH